MDIDELLCHMDLLYKTALTKTRNADLAEDFVQETYLHALSALAKGTKILNPKAYLLSVLRNRFFMDLRKRYKISTIYYDEMPEELSCKENPSDTVIQSEEMEAIRRELSFLSKTYRDVMVLYYMKNQSVAQIAKTLSIPKGTVLSRLDVGREKVRKGVETMEAYQTNSYQPETLTIGINGRIGQNREPFSCIQNSMEQNILIIAYEKPLSVSEIAQALGVPMAFMEEAVEKLVDAQLMKRIGTKVATDFVILGTKDRDKSLALCKAFAAETFDAVHPVFMHMVEQYQAIQGFSAYNQTQRYIQAVLSARQSYIWRLEEAVTGEKSIDFADYPDRPNYGKWVASGGRYPHGYDFDDERSKYAVSGRCNVDNINETILSLTEWDTAVGHTHMAKFKYGLSERERALAIDAVRTDSVNAFQAELMPDLERLGFLKEENGKKIPAVPYITKEENAHFFEIEREAGKAFCDVCLEKAVKICRDNPISYPKHIAIVPEFIHIECMMDLPMAYVYEAAKRGIIVLEPNKSYPIMYLVMR